MHMVVVAGLRLQSIVALAVLTLDLEWCWLTSFVENKASAEWQRILDGGEVRLDCNLER